MADLLHLVDKPEGWTSHDVVARMRTILGERRVGHAGTLDPMASGLLIVGEGRATSLLSCFAMLPKHYLARTRLGISTDTQDRTGSVVERRSAIPDAATVAAALDRFRGRIAQTPPLYSAVKVGGERLYKAARRGEEVERTARPVHVYAISLVDSPAPDEITLDVTVSRGTYVRTLAHDLGEALGCGAHLVALRRTRSGPFRVEDALDPAKESGHDAASFRSRAITPERALSFLPHVRLDAAESARLRHGAAPVLTAERVTLPDTEDPLPPGETGWPLALLDDGGSLLALAKPWEAQASGERASLLRVVGSAA
jgi:tRNA pseudouridine55 synthase